MEGESGTRPSALPGLYLITGAEYLSEGRPLHEAVGAALEAGVRCVQLREKGLAAADLLSLAWELRELTARFGARLLINGRADIAALCDADGVHLGTEDIPVEDARGVAAEGALVGVSTHGLDEARAAEQAGADYILLGPVFHTPSKARYGTPVGVETLRAVAASVSIPVFAVGGVCMDNIDDVMRAGACGAAVIRAVLAAPEIKKNTGELIEAIAAFTRRGGAV